MISMFRHPILALLMFITAYFVTISVRANAQDTVVTGDTIQLQEDQKALMTGRITEVADAHFDMESNGKTLRIFLKDVDLKRSADGVFSPGMYVTVRGDLRGEEFGKTLVRADSVVASATPTATIVEDKKGN